MATSFTYNKNEKLKSRKQLDELFASGKSVSAFPVKIIFSETKELYDVPVKAGVSVSKRYFKKAVSRNRIKRLLRECYRLHKQPLLDICKTNGKQFNLFILYLDKTLPDYTLLNEKVQQALEKLVKQVA